MEQISYDHFAALEIKIGTILTAELVPDSDKLLKLSVNVGEAEPRQIISGIRAFFSDPNTLVGKQSLFLTNLAPRTIRGLESQGMILAGGDDETFTLLEPGQPVPPGTLVH